MRQLKPVLVILFVVIAAKSWSQTQSDFPGDWNVTKVVVSDKTGEISPETIKKIETMFMQTQFHFKADGIFVIDSPQKALQFKKSNWIFNDKDKTILVNGTDMDGKEGQLMKMFVKTDSGKWVFELDEAPIRLEVQKAVAKK
jgi:hypothetical protein